MKKNMFFLSWDVWISFLSFLSCLNFFSFFCPIIPLIFHNEELQQLREALFTSLRVCMVQVFTSLAWKLLAFPSLTRSTLFFSLSPIHFHTIIWKPLKGNFFVHFYVQILLLFIFCCLLSVCGFLGRVEFSESFLGFPELGCRKTQVGIWALVQNLFFPISMLNELFWVSSSVNYSYFAGVWVLV